MNPRMTYDVVTLVALLVGWLVGSIPIGWLLLRKKYRVDLLKEGSGGIGATNVERVLTELVGKPRAKKLGKMIELADMLKGLLPFVAARYWLDFDTRQLSVVGAALILGHCYSAFLHFKGGKGVATTMGIAAGTCWYIAVFCYVVWFALKKLLAKQTAEATALASIRAAILLLPLNFFFIHDFNLRGFFCLAVLHIILTHRANLRRYREEQKEKAMLVKPKAKKRQIGGDMPTGVFITDTATNNPETIKRLLMQKRRFAWLIQLLPAKFVMNFVLPIIPMKLLKMGEVIHHGTSGSVRVITWGYPRTPKWMHEHPDRSVRELVSLARYLEKIGADKLCLGATTKGVGDKGRTIQTSVGIPVTNGNRSTIGWAVEGTLVLAELLHLNLAESTATVVGPGGSVGDGVCRMLLKAGVKRLFLVGSTPGKQAKQAIELSRQFDGRIVEDCTLMDALRESQIAVFASSATSRETRHEIDVSLLPTGLIVLDMERPRGVSIELEGYTRLLANDGTMVAIDSEGKAGLGLPPGIYFPCYSELVLMLLRDWKNKWCYPATLCEIESLHQAAIAEGFTMASFRLNDKPITPDAIQDQIALIRLLSAAVATNPTGGV